MGDRRFEAEGLFGGVGPCGVARAEVRTLFGVGQQEADGLIDDVDGGLVAGAEHQHDGAQQFGLGQTVSVAFAVADADQVRDQILAGFGALGGDELGDDLEQGAVVGVRLHDGEGGVEDAVDDCPEAVQPVGWQAHEVADDSDGHRVGEMLAQVGGLAGGPGLQRVEDAVDSALHEGAESGDAAG